MPKTRKPPDPRRLGVATRAIHGARLFPHRGPVAPPIVQTSTYRLADSRDAVRYAAGDPGVLVYSRYHNPTVGEAEERLALLMRTEKALLFSSGMAAISSAILSVAGSGDEILSTPALYGGTYRFFRDVLPRLGIRTRYVRPDRLEEIPRMTSRRTRVVYFETPTNPTLDIVDIDALVRATRAAERKHGKRILILADNTFATVINQNPVALGADAMTESATKYLGGHSDLLGGVVAGSAPFVRGVHTMLKYLGGCADPFAAFLLLRSLNTFELRVHRQNSSALALAAHLEKHPKVNFVLYPGLPSHPQHVVACRQMSGGGFGGMITIEVKGGVRGAVRFCDALSVAVNAMSLGGTETLVSIPVYSSHVNMTAGELKRHGVTPGMVRISVGVEDLEDLIADVDRAMESV
jgi:cystathionine beta-lyase/cystathionine gamma-synthase